MKVYRPYYTCTRGTSKAESMFAEELKEWQGAGLIGGFQHHPPRVQLVIVAGGKQIPLPMYYRPDFFVWNDTISAWPDYYVEVKRGKNFSPLWPTIRALWPLAGPIPLMVATWTGRKRIGWDIEYVATKQH